MIKAQVLLPSQLPEVYKRIEPYLPDRVRDYNTLVQLYLDKSTLFFEIGDFEGVFWLSDLVPGWYASVHIVTWSNAITEKYARARTILKDIMFLFRLQKLVARIPIIFPEAIKFVEELGFSLEGTHKLGDRYNDEYVTVFSYGLFPEDV